MFETGAGMAIDWVSDQAPFELDGIMGSKPFRHSFPKLGSRFDAKLTGSLGSRSSDLE
jgi:hypothetical protein